MDIRPNPHTKPAPEDLMEHAKAPERKNDDIRDISLDQKKPLGSKDRIITINKSRNHEAKGEPGSPDPPAPRCTLGSMSGKSLHGKTRSDGTSADLNRQRWSPDHSEYRRDPEDRDSGSSP